MGWCCVHIRSSPLFEATTRTFVSLLKSEHRSDPTVGRPVYGAPAIDGYCYYFSPQAAVQHNIFLKSWGGFEVPAPKDLKTMTRIV